MLRQRKSAETLATKMERKVRSLDAKIWRLYREITKGTCSIAKYTHIFEAIDERAPLERRMEDAKKRMLTIDDQIRDRRTALSSLIKNTDQYVFRMLGGKNGFEENLT